MVKQQMDTHSQQICSKNTPKMKSHSKHTFLIEIYQAETGNNFKKKLYLKRINVGNLSEKSVSHTNFSVQI